MNFLVEICFVFEKKKKQSQNIYYKFFITEMKTIYLFTFVVLNS